MWIISIKNYYLKLQFFLPRIINNRYLKLYNSQETID